MISKHLRRMAAIALASNLVLAMPSGLFAAPAPGNDASESAHTTTPIKHVIVIFGENISFDHYFATYPHATNPQGEPAFHAKDDTPRANNLLTGGLLDRKSELHAALPHGHRRPLRHLRPEP